jgi:hypothetical protein
LRIARTDEFLKGGFRNATPERGPFRHYLKASLSHLVHQDRARRRPAGELPDDLTAPEADEPVPGEREFEAECMKALLDRAFALFEAEFADTATPYAEALRLAMDPDFETNERRAEALAAKRSEPYSVDRYKKILSRSRHAFARHLYEEVARSLDDDGPDAVVEELAALGLLSYCEAFVPARAAATP